MPRGDRTGPMGDGPMTGRGLGNCTGYPAPGYATPGYGRGRGAGGRGGMGRRNRYYATGVPGWRRAIPVPDYGPPAEYAPPAPPDNVAVLKAEAEYLAAALEETKARLAKLESGDNE